MKLTGRCGTRGQGGVDSSPLFSVSPQGFRHFVTVCSETDGAVGLETRWAAELRRGGLRRAAQQGLSQGGLLMVHYHNGVYPTRQRYFPLVTFGLHLRHQVFDINYCSVIWDFFYSITMKLL